MKHCQLINNSIHYLNFGKHSNDGYYDAEDQVEADEDLVLGAVIRLGVEHVEKHNSSESKGEVDDGDEEQRCNDNMNKVEHLLYPQTTKHLLSLALNFSFF